MINEFFIMVFLKLVNWLFFGLCINDFIVNKKKGVGKINVYVFVRV